MIDNVNNSQNSCHIMQMFQIMQKNQAAPAIPVNNAGALFQMMMLQVVQKMAASMDLFAPLHGAVNASPHPRTSHSCNQATHRFPDEIFTSMPSLSRRLCDDY